MDSNIFFPCVKFWGAFTGPQQVKPPQFRACWVQWAAGRLAVNRLSFSGTAFETEDTGFQKGLSPSSAKGRRSETREAGRGRGEVTRTPPFSRPVALKG